MTPTLTQVLLALIALAGGAGSVGGAISVYARGVGSYEGQ